MKTLYFRSIHPDEDGKKLELTLSVEPDGSYQIQKGELSQWIKRKFDRRIITPDNFKKLLFENGFDVDEVIMDIETLIESESKEGIV